MNTETKPISAVDLMTAAAILRPGSSTRTLAAITGLDERHISATMSMLKSLKMVSMKMDYRQARWTPLKALRNEFRVTNEMIAMLGLNEVGAGGRRRKGKNTVIEECKKSEAMQRVLWFYGRGEMPLCHISIV